jgi:hypothetical protein
VGIERIFRARSGWERCNVFPASGKLIYRRGGDGIVATSGALF